MKQTSKIELTEPFRRLVCEYSKSERQKIAKAIDAIAYYLEQFHIHSGLGVRRLHEKTFECRVGIHIRLVFEVEFNVATFKFIGNHDQVKKYIKNL